LERFVEFASAPYRRGKKSDHAGVFSAGENDHDLGPSRTLAAELQKLGKPYKLLIFPPYGQTHEEGHGGFCMRATNVWGPAVISFLDAAMEK